MASVKAFIRVSSSKKKLEKEVAVRFRVSDGRKIQLFYKSDILVDPAVWDAKRECIIAKVLFKTIDRVLFDESIRRMKTTLETAYQEAENKDTLTSEDFELLVDMKLHPENYKAEKETRDRDFFKILPSYVEEKYQTLHKVEPYVNCQMVAGKDAFKPGEGKNSWLTGTAAWMWYTVEVTM